MKRYFLLVLLAIAVSGCSKTSDGSIVAKPSGEGPYSVGSTNMEVLPEFADIGNEAMHDYLLGRPTDSGRPRFIADILKYPESAWVTDVQIPDRPALYGPASGQTLPVVTFITYPSNETQRPNTYEFPYHDSGYGVFEDMLGPGETPSLADTSGRYPLVIIAHGASAHGVYDVKHAHNLASHGYIVAVITYGDDRTAIPNSPSHHVAFMRPLLTKAVLDSILDSEVFGPYIDADNIGITGHSFGGFTALAVAGGPYQGDPGTVSDERIKAGVLAAPWVGHSHNGKDTFAFGPENNALENVAVPMIWFFGTKDEATRASFILPAARRSSGPTYVVELVDQPHIFEQGSWQDRDNWELLFFSAYLKNNPESLATLKSARSMKGGNEDVQLFDYQK